MDAACELETYLIQLRKGKDMVERMSGRLWLKYMVNTQSSIDMHFFRRVGDKILIIRLRAAFFSLRLTQ